MNRTATERAIKICLNEIRVCLDEAAAMAKAAEAFASAGQAGQGVEMSLDIEQASYEATRLLDAASLLSRLSND
ncbi:MAG: hypothetical protein KJZ73_12080 [Pseudorhodoplanes sp.]|nr:hypothetical protein [Pseudorhodoplanes sp.]